MSLSLEKIAGALRELQLRPCGGQPALGPICRAYLAGMVECFFVSIRLTPTPAVAGLTR
jgi:hypothetical protein